MCKKIALIYFVTIVRPKGILKIVVLSCRNRKIVDITIRQVKTIVLKPLSSALTGKHDLFNQMFRFKTVSLILMLIIIPLKPRLVKITAISLAIYVIRCSLL